METNEEDPIRRDVHWPYEQYYLGPKDKDERRHGVGENHWTGAESLESYNGQWVRDTMNGKGDYRWKYRYGDHAFFTYEGRFFINTMHGYGVMSYPDGSIFKGLYYRNVRWGPGVESHFGPRKFLCNVGFWRKNQLVRLGWRPQVPCLTMDLMSGETWKAVADPHRTVLMSDYNIIGSTNSAMDLLKQHGTDPVKATEIWHKLYSKHSSDIKSVAFYRDAFERSYYDGKIYCLNEVKKILDPEMDSFFAWNNSPAMIHMMKHCYKNEIYRRSVNLALEDILNGNRRRFPPPEEHERDCRTLLMACYLGRIDIVTILVNECNVYPDVADAKGNTPLIYATCADHAKIIHFLKEAGANVNAYNDSCCTALGVAIMRLACLKREIVPNSIIEALLPSKASILLTPYEPQYIFEWLVTREFSFPTPNKQTDTANDPSTRRKSSKSLTKMKSTNLKLTPMPNIPQKFKFVEYDSDDSYSDEKCEYLAVKHEYSNRVNYGAYGPKLLANYIFSIDPIIVGSEITNVDAKHESDKKIHSTKEKQQVPVRSTDILLWHKGDNFDSPMNSYEKLRMENFSTKMLTIIQLLEDGADPKLVKCPQPALFMAVLLELPDLVDCLIQYGADVNEQYPQAYNYTALDIMISRPFTYDNLQVIKSLLKNGADATHRLPFDYEPGPTLLHAILSRPREFEYEEDIFRNVVDQLVYHDCDPTAFFQGRATIDLVITSYIELFTLFIKHEKRQLNSVINDQNQTILVKMFSVEFFEDTMHTDVDRDKLLYDVILYGADPLMECEFELEKYKNIVAVARKTISLYKREPEVVKQKPPGLNKSASKSIPKEDPKAKPKVKERKATDFDKVLPEYERITEQVADIVRQIHIRWLQTKLLKELVAVIAKYKYRPWVMILKEHTNQNGAKFWLTPDRCLDIWNILKGTNKKIYKDAQVMKFLLYTVQFYNTISNFYPNELPMTGTEKRLIEADVAKIIKYHASPDLHIDSSMQLKSLNFLNKPELISTRASNKFDICFECAMPLNAKIIPCTICESVKFCSCTCLENNVLRKCHPCDKFLKQYYPCEDYPWRNE